jgi:pyrimidine-nucleoside phosphorylase
MTPALIIAKKRDGRELGREEIAAFVHGFTRGSIPEYQMAAFAMATFLRGMTTDETAALTDAMLQSGVWLVWPNRQRLIVDKHSTGGIGDKTSLVLAPLLAARGLAVPMISGRGLGATGGTLDKLEAIPGFRTDLSLDEIQATVERVGCVITGASAEIVPADRKLYALRDVTATVPSIPLITASIMSKKLAESLDALVLDVKFGSGAFMKSLDDARALARSLVNTGRRMGVKTTALLTDMNQPLGRMAGNLVEVHEAIAVLKGRGPTDVWEATRELGVELLVSAGIATDAEAARTQLLHEIESGRALAKFREMVAAQGGNLDQLSPAGKGVSVTASRAGFVGEIETERLGIAIIELGGGRKRMGDPIDHAAGLEMFVRVGDPVKRGQRLARLFGPDDKVADVKRLVADSIDIRKSSREALPLIAERIE